MVRIMVSVFMMSVLTLKDHDDDTDDDIDDDTHDGGRGNLYPIKDQASRTLSRHE